MMPADCSANLAEDLAASAGSACHSGATMISYVLQAMGVEPALARATVRLSLGRFTTEEEIDRAVELILDDEGLTSTREAGISEFPPPTQFGRCRP